MAEINLFPSSPLFFNRPVDGTDGVGSGGDTKEELSPTWVSLLVITPRAGGSSSTTIGQAVASIVASRLSAQGGLKIITQIDISKILGLEEAKQVMGCDITSCIEEIAGALNVDFLVTGNIDILGGAYVGGFQLIDVRKIHVEGRAQFRVQRGKDSELVDRINEAVDELVKPLSEKKRKEGSSFAWAGSLWKGIAERPHRTLMWSSFAVSVAGVAFGEINRRRAESEATRYVGFVNQLRSDGKIVGESGDLHFRDGEAKAASQSELQAIANSVRIHDNYSVAGFVGAAVFAGLGGMSLWLDASRNGEQPAAKVAFQPFGGGIQVSFGGSF